MTREKAIELIGSMKGDLSDFYDDNDLVALDMAILALSDYEKMQKISLDLAFENDELMNKMNELSAENKGEWIPVSERLPEEEYEVYCQLSDGSNAVLYVQDNWGQMEWVDGMMGTGTYDVVAWMEKPEPYKKGGE